MARAFHFLSTKYALQALQSGEIKVSRFGELNDPFELYGADLSNPSHRKEFRAFKNWASERFGLIWSNPLLWSHYAEKHHGIALEFNLADEVVSEIQYSAERMRLDIEERLRGAGFTQKDAYSLAVTKSKHWKYEKEIRIFVNLDDCRLKDSIYFEPLNESVKITGAILGPLCNLPLREIEAALPAGKKLSVVRSRLAFRSFNVVKNQAFKKRVIYGAA